MTFCASVFLLGAQKSGTSTLAALLGQHPAVCVTDPKEPHYFTHHLNKGEGWYRECFSRPDAPVRLDASTSYTMAPMGPDRPEAMNVFAGVPERIHAACPDARFIYIMREPVARTYSGYWHSVRTGREQRSLHDALEQYPFFLDVSNYAGQIALWLKHFPRESFLFLLFEDMVKNPLGVATICYDFLGIDPGVEVHIEAPRNVSLNTNWLGRRIRRISQDKSALGRALDVTVRCTGKLLPASVKEKLMGGLIPKISAADKERLAPGFTDQIRELETITGLSLDHWK